MYNVLKERFSSLTNKELVEVIELPQAYTEEAILIAKNVLLERRVLESSIKELSHQFWRAYINKHFKTILSKKMRFTSPYTSEDDMKALFDEALENFKERKELFEIDITKYWGAAL